MSAEENEALVRRYFEEAWVKRNMAAVDELMVPNYVEHQIPDGRLTSRHSLKQLLAMYYKAFPDMKSVLHDIFAQGDRMMYRWSVSATHLGDWVGIPPTGNHMRATGITIYRIVGQGAGGLVQRSHQPLRGRTAVALRRREDRRRLHREWRHPTTWAGSGALPGLRRPDPEPYLALSGSGSPRGPG